MNRATVIGIALGSLVVVVAIALGGSGASFAALIVMVGGVAAATLIRFPLVGLAEAVRTGMRAVFLTAAPEPRALIETIAEMGDLVRRSGPLGLEGMELDDANLRKGAQMIAEGFGSAVIREAMELGRERYLGQLATSQRLSKSLGEAALVFGAIGTLVGLVMTLGASHDLASLGPGLASALTTTLYSAAISCLIFLPISGRLVTRIERERTNQALIVDGIVSVRDGKSPNLIRESLFADLPDRQRDEPTAEAA